MTKPLKVRWSCRSTLGSNTFSLTSLICSSFQREVLRLFFWPTHVPRWRFGEAASQSVATAASDSNTHANTKMHNYKSPEILNYGNSRSAQKHLMTFQVGEAAS